MMSVAPDAAVAGVGDGTGVFGVSLASVSLVDPVFAGDVVGVSSGAGVSVAGSTGVGDAVGIVVGVCVAVGSGGFSVGVGGTVGVVVGWL